MGKPASVVWGNSLLGYDMGADHPLNPIRLDLTVRLATALGVLDGVELLAPRLASENEVELVHDPGYVAAVRAAPDGSLGTSATASARPTIRCSRGCTRPPAWSSAPP